MELLPIQPTLSENKRFTDHPDCQDSIYMTLDFYKRVGFEPPWISVNQTFMPFFRCTRFLIRLRDTGVIPRYEAM